MARRSRAGGARKRPVRYATSADAPGLEVAVRAHRKGLLREAVEGYEQVVSSAPGCLDAWANLGSALAQLGHAREAVEAFARAVALGRHDARALRDAGVGLAWVGEGPRAVAALEASIAVDPGLVGAWLVLARVRAEQGDDAGAIEAATGAVERAPHDPSAHLEVFRAVYDDRSPGAAIEAARRAVALDPTFAHARYLLAGALGFEGRGDAAREALGDEGLVSEGLRDALAYAAMARARGARCFATKRATLAYAVEQASLPGVVIELGVRHGVSTRLLAALCEGVAVHAFDSFEGLPLPWQRRPAGAFSTAGQVPAVPDNVTLHVGRFEQRLAPFVAALDAPPRLVHVDCDLYESARFSLDTLAPVVRPGCVLAFDEYVGNPSWRDDEHRALHEAAARWGWSCDEVVVNWVTGQGVVVVRSVV